jgi:transcriptional regulator
MIYVPEMFAERDEARLFELIDRNPFATLVSRHKRETWISHLPFLADRNRRVLRAHMARANPHWKTFESGAGTLAIFQGPHHYVSPAWYSQQPSVPTWNFATVHVEGRPVIVREREATRRLLADLVARMEQGPDAWRMRLPEDYLDAMLDAIVAFELPILSWVGKFKLSQNRPVDDRPRVIAALEATGSDAGRDVARLMRQRPHPS